MAMEWSYWSIKMSRDLRFRLAHMFERKEYLFSCETLGQCQYYFQHQHYLLLLNIAALLILGVFIYYWPNNKNYYMISDLFFFVWQANLSSQQSIVIDEDSIGVVMWYSWSINLSKTPSKLQVGAFQWIERKDNLPLCGQLHHISNKLVVVAPRSQYLFDHSWTSDVLPVPSQLSVFLSLRVEFCVILEIHIVVPQSLLPVSSDI